MAKIYEVTPEIRRGMCSRCARPPSKYFHFHIAKVINRETNEEEWLCNKHVRRYDTMMAKQLTNLDKPFAEEKIKKLSR